MNTCLPISSDLHCLHTVNWYQCVVVIISMGMLTVGLSHMRPRELSPEKNVLLTFLHVSNVNVIESIMEKLRKPGEKPIIYLTNVIYTFF